MDELKQNRQKLETIDEQMAALFEERMAISRQIADYKRENALPVLDAERERILLEKNAEKIADPAVREYTFPFSGRS